MSKVNPKFWGLSQYKAPFNYELAGKHFHFFMDDGKEYTLNFLDGEFLQWAERGKPYIGEPYECLKGDDTTYFVHVQPGQYDGKVNHAWVIDLLQNLVTLVVTEEGVIPAGERLVRVTPVFGAIKLPGRALSEKRHCFTDRTVGRHISWHYNPSVAVPHIYHTPTLYRLPMTSDDEMRKRYDYGKDPEQREKMDFRMAYRERTRGFYPIVEEPCFHIRINDNLNLFCFCEENETVLDPLQALGGGGLILLQDIERLVDVGLSYCKGDYYMVQAFGVENEDGDPVDKVPSPYDQTKLQTMPCIYDIKL